jgi:hypothetical protein
MHKAPTEITRLIHENFWIVMSFVFAKPQMAALLGTKFHGEWEYLHKSIYELAEVRADRALLEMATQLRVLDDQQGLSAIYQRRKEPPLGLVVQGDGRATPLHFRDATNKIMHAALFEWDLNPAEPRVICLPHDAERWKHAEITLLHWMGLIGGLAF